MPHGKPVRATGRLRRMYPGGQTCPRLFSSSLVTANRGTGWVVTPKTKFVARVKSVPSLDADRKFTRVAHHKHLNCQHSGPCIPLSKPPVSRHPLQRIISFGDRECEPERVRCGVRYFDTSSTIDDPSYDETARSYRSCRMSPNLGESFWCRLESG